MGARLALGGGDGGPHGANALEAILRALGEETNARGASVVGPEGYMIAMHHRGDGYSSPPIW